MRHLDQFLKQRRDRWYYVRRVPRHLSELDGRDIIRTALKTSSKEVARVRRDALAEADDHYWATLLASTQDDGSLRNPKSTLSNAQLRYQSAKRRAMARGYIYQPTETLIQAAPTSELVDRLKHVGSKAKFDEREAEAVLGTVKPAAPRISQALETYFKFISTSSLLNKSEAQKQTYFKPKRRAVANFIALFGDLPMDDITRSHAREFHAWWTKRLQPTDGSKPLSADSANRDIGNLRNLFKEFWAYEGEETRENPFRNLRFKDVVYKEIPPFSDDWVQSRVLVPGLFDDINREAALIVYAMIETGCRPSELANLLPSNIILDDEVPHIQIRPRADRKLKSVSSARDIPLLGVSLNAFQQAPDGFAHFRDRGNLLSSSLMKAFRARNLFESDDHRIYSFRHSFEKRMLEAEIDYGLRCLLMGHSNSRPSYGDGGSLAYRRSQLEKIAHPVSEALQASICAL